MFFLILFLPFLGVLGGCLFGRFSCFCLLYFYIINTSFFYFLKKWYTDRFINETSSLFFLQISKNYMYTKL